MNLARLASLGPVLLLGASQTPLARLEARLAGIANPAERAVLLREALDRPTWTHEQRLRLLLSLAVTELERYRAREALALFEELQRSARRDELDARAHAMLGIARCYVLLGQRDRAFATYRAVAERFPGTRHERTARRALEDETRRARLVPGLALHLKPPARDLYGRRVRQPKEPFLVAVDTSGKVPDPVLRAVAAVPGLVAWVFVGETSALRHHSPPGTGFERRIHPLPGIPRQLPRGTWLLVGPRLVVVEVEPSARRIARRLLRR